MKVVLQRVNYASVHVNDQIINQIKEGLLLFVGITHTDQHTDIEWMVRKIINMRIFNDSDDKMNLSVKDIKGEILVISQFTLYASTKKGNRPSFTNSAPPTFAKERYMSFLSELKYQTTLPIKAGIFGADMIIQLLNNGPVTIIIDSKQKE